MSNPKATGGGGNNFEVRVQALMALFMLTYKIPPIIPPSYSITKIHLQAANDGYKTDDCILYAESRYGEKSKLLCQIKSSHIKLGGKDKELVSTLKNAWLDFNNSDIFDREADHIVMIACHVDAKQVKDLQEILNIARNTMNYSTFNNNISSSAKQKILNNFSEILGGANGSLDCTDEMFLCFLKRFRFITYQLDSERESILPLIYNLLSAVSGNSASNQKNGPFLWAKILEEVAEFNESGAIISRESFSPEILDAIFLQAKVQPEFISAQTLPDDALVVSGNIPVLKIFNFFGRWSENSEADKQIVSEFVQKSYSEWVERLLELRQKKNQSINFSKGVWRLTHSRKVVWKVVAEFITDNDLDAFKRCVLKVLSINDPYDKKYSSQLKAGLAETLALLGSNIVNLPNCSVSNKAEKITITTVRELFKNAKGEQWYNLRQLLPVLAEASPNEFLKAVENSLSQVQCPLDTLSSHSYGGYGLMQALEVLAWDSKYLIRVCVILSKLDDYLTRSQFLISAFDTLVMILLPWLPQTTASLEKQKAVITTLEKENLSIVWKLLLALLPDQNKTSTCTRKPQWYRVISDNLSVSVSQKEYWEQVSFYAKKATNMALSDVNKLKVLINYLNKLPEQCQATIIEQLSLETFSEVSDKDKLDLWLKLTELFEKHERYSYTAWALAQDTLFRVKEIVDYLEPNDLEARYKRLFTNDSFSLYSGKGTYEQQRQGLKERQKQAITDILQSKGLELVVEFASRVGRPYDVGYSLGTLDSTNAHDSTLLRQHLDSANEKLAEFSDGYIDARFKSEDWGWADDVIKTQTLSSSQLARFFTVLPFNHETWQRVAKQPNDVKSLYWKKVHVRPFQTNDDLTDVIKKLVDYNNPAGAIDCISKLIKENQEIDQSIAIKALLNIDDGNFYEKKAGDYNITILIKKLQNEANPHPNLYRVEWKYFSLFENNSEIRPIMLEKRLASDYSYFYEMVKTAYELYEQSPGRELNGQQRIEVMNARKLLDNWKCPPGMLTGNKFSFNNFKAWFDKVDTLLLNQQLKEFAYEFIGKVLIYTPKDERKDLWIDDSIANFLNVEQFYLIRKGFWKGLFNLRSVHKVDPTGEPEKKLADNYATKADALENAGYHRFALILQELSDFYLSEKKRIIDEY